MKRRVTVLIIMTLLSSLAFSHDSMSRRGAWWENNLRLLKLEKEKLEKKDALDPVMSGYLEREIERADRMISVFRQWEGGSQKSGDNSSSAAVSEDSIEKKIRPMVSLMIMKAAVTEIDSASDIPRVKDMVKERITAMALERFSADIDELVEITLNSYIDRGEWKILAGEVLLGSLVTRRDALVREVNQRIKENMEKAAGETQEKLPMAGIREAISMSGLPVVDADALERSWLWRQKKYLIEKEFNQYKEIIELMPGGADIPLAKIRYYYRNPQAMDAILFTATATTTGGDETVEAPAGEGGLDAAVVLVIPQLPDINLICREIDTRRQRALLHLREKSDSAYAASVNDEFEKTIIGHTARCNNIFLHEEKKIKENKYRSEDLANFREFERTKKEFRAQLQLCYDYKNRSRDFIFLVSGWRDLSRDRLMELFEYQMERSGRYMSSVKALVQDSASLFRESDRSIYADFTATVRRLDGLSRFVMGGMRFNRELHMSLQGNDIRSLRTRQVEYSSQVKNWRHEMGGLYSEYLKNREAGLRGEREQKNSMRDTVAQVEVDTVMAGLRDCQESLKRYNYAESALASYRIAYDRLYQDARDGNATADLEQVLARGTIMPGVEDFSSDTIEKEKAGRAYFIRKNRIAISRLIAVLQYYRHAGVEVEGYPTAVEIRAMEDLLERRPSVKVSAWDMNEANFAIVDRKAAAVISQTMKRSLWDRGAEKEKEENVSVTVVSESGLTLSIPRGWKEAGAAGRKNSTGVIRRFSSIDRETDINLVRLTLDGGNIKDVSNRWLAEKGHRPLKEKWGKQDDMEYYWVLARGRDSRISECYVISRGGSAWILEGNSPKVKYALFKGKLDEVFRSIR